ncbi:hypothetical protein [Cutibacterium namnetense]|uniref:hypothetical protein n=1 Tax=Cutibacterium namnetense TaxID=1574624 RepID=UPI0002DA33D0|nr:hypothetical protein [Cutibacterium namnetense]
MIIDAEDAREAAELRAKELEPAAPTILPTSSTPTRRQHERRQPAHIRCWGG